MLCPGKISYLLQQNLFAVVIICYKHLIILFLLLLFVFFFSHTEVQISFIPQFKKVLGHYFWKMFCGVNLKSLTLDCF